MTKSIAEILRVTPRELEDISETTRLDVECLLMHICNCSRAHLFSHNDDILTPAAFDTFKQLLAKRKQGCPIAYITGVKEFWSLPFNVDERCLIPRAETECLVETALACLPANEPLNLVDLGTGSGAIAISLAKERPKWQILATDKFPEPLALAQMNARQLNITNVRFVQSDWFDGLQGQQFDAIISNPPYISIGDPHLRAPTLQFEPKSALTAGEDGLDCLRQLIHHAPKHLIKNGILIVEHGADQAAALHAILHDNNFTNIETIRDLAKLDRATLARHKIELAH